MRVINIVVYILIIGILIIQKGFYSGKAFCKKHCKEILEKYRYLLVVLFVTNTISFAMTYMEKEERLFIERDSYGGQQQEQELLLKTGEEEEEWSLSVNARMLTEEELQQRTKEAFIYLDTHMKGENASLQEVRENLDYSLDYEQFPFDAEFVSDNYTLLDEEGTLKNDNQALLEMGYHKSQIEEGIPVKLTVTLWYGELSFVKEYALTIFQREQTALEEAFTAAKEAIEKEEKEAGYEAGFYVPSKVGQVEIVAIDEGKVTPSKVWIAGVILAVLLVLREKENEKRSLQERREYLLRSYPWFVNELLLLMGAGMQIRNIFPLLIRDFETDANTMDYRVPLINEIKVAAQALELGMSEEQVYYKLGRRLELPCYVKIMTLLEQNVKRGGKGIAVLFEQEELQALEERKNLAKRLGEEAGTKLLGPMLLLLLTIMIMIMLPAFWGFA